MTPSCIGEHIDAGRARPLQDLGGDLVETFSHIAGFFGEFQVVYDIFQVRALFERLFPSSCYMSGTYRGFYRGPLELTSAVRTGLGRSLSSGSCGCASTPNYR